MQSFSSRIWTRVAVSIFYDDNHYTMGYSLLMLFQRSPYVLIKKGDVSILNGSCLQSVDKFTYLGSGISSTENDINLRQATAWTAIGWLSIIWKSDLSDKIKCNFFQAAVVSILFYGSTTKTLTKHMEKKQDGNCSRMLWAILNIYQGNNTLQKSSYMATYLRSLKLSK